MFEPKVVCPKCGQSDQVLEVANLFEGLYRGALGPQNDLGKHLKPPPMYRLLGGFHILVLGVLPIILSSPTTLFGAIANPNWTRALVAIWIVAVLTVVLGIVSMFFENRTRNRAKWYKAIHNWSTAYVCTRDTTVFLKDNPLFVSASQLKGSLTEWAKLGCAKLQGL